MIPGEIITPDGEIEINVGRDVIKIRVYNTGDRPIQVGSHFHFYEVNSYLKFRYEGETIERFSTSDITLGRRLNIPAGTAIRFEPDDEEGQEVELIPFAGKREIYGFNGLINGKLTQ